MSVDEFSKRCDVIGNKLKSITLSTQAKDGSDAVFKKISKYHGEVAGSFGLFNMLYETRIATGLTAKEVEGLDWQTAWSYYQKHIVEKMFNHN